MGSVSQLGYFSSRKGRGTNTFPKGILFGALALLVFAAGAVVFGQATGIGVIKHRAGSPVAIRDITITRSADDTVIVTDVRTGDQIAAYKKNTGGFVRGSLRAFERMRMVAKVSETAPYRIIKWQAGTVSLSDTATGERIYLEAFGKDNVAAYETLLGQGEGARQ